MSWKRNATAWRELYRQVREEDTGEAVRVESEFRRLAENDTKDELLEAAWGLIANSYGGNWDHASEASGWKAAAERWRDQYFPESPDAEVTMSL